MELLIVDNHDSFTFNLVELCRNAGISDLSVVPNNAVDLGALKNIPRIIISPGPGLPDETENLTDIIEQCSENSSILGICLGFQAIVESYGGSLKQLDHIQHGIVSYISAKEGSSLFNKIESPFPAGRYHSWRADRIPDCMDIIAWSADIPMAIKHKSLDVQGLQFHPESFLTPSGLQIIRNWSGIDN